MRTLHFYLTRQILAALLMTVAVFAGVLLLSNVLKEVITLLISGQAPFTMLAQAVFVLVPWVLVFALPMGLLTAALLVFGRLSADHELTAVRAGGVSLVALISPVLLLSLALSIVCAWVNLQIAPQSRTAYKKLLLGAGAASIGTLLPEKTFIKDFPGRIIYVGSVRGSQLEDILLYELNDEGKVEFYVRAAEGTLKFDAANRKVTVEVRDAWRVGWREGKLVPVHIEETEVTVDLMPEKERRRRLSEMTFLELREELRTMEERLGHAPDLPTGAGDEKRARLAEFRKQRNDLTLPIRVQMHRQVSLSFACLGFTLVGIPLGIRAHRRETTFGIMIALILVILYYGFFILGEALDGRPEYLPHLIVWMPNFLFQIVGATLLWRANRGG